MSLICISILSLSACTSIATVLTGVVGVGDSYLKEVRINKLDNKIKSITKVKTTPIKK